VWDLGCKDVADASETDCKKGDIGHLKADLIGYQKNPLYRLKESYLRQEVICKTIWNLNLNCSMTSKCFFTLKIRLFFLIYPVIKAIYFTIYNAFISPSKVAVASSPCNWKPQSACLRHW
jgi:hypothetical protein